jgi:hypothetical protein
MFLAAPRGVGVTPEFTVTIIMEGTFVKLSTQREHKTEQRRKQRNTQKQASKQKI